MKELIEFQIANTPGDIKLSYIKNIKYSDLIVHKTIGFNTY